MGESVCPHALPPNEYGTLAGMNNPLFRPSAEAGSLILQIEIDRVDADGIDELLNLYMDLFHDREPLTKWIGFSRERMASIARAMHASSDYDHFPQQKPCWIARVDGEENRNVGFIVCDDPAVEGNPSLPDDLTEQEKEKVLAITALLEEIRRPVHDWITMGAGKCLHVSAIGVAPGCEGKGIAKRLLQTALSDAGRSGFQVVFSECTSRASRMLHEKLGFECLKSVSPQTLVVNGEKPFADCDLELFLMEKRFDEKAAR